MEGIVSEGVYNWNRKSAVKQAIAVLTKCSSLTNF